MDPAIEATAEECHIFEPPASANIADNPANLTNEQITSGSKKAAKQRKPQSQQEFDQQVSEYKDGPPIQQEGWLDNKDFDSESKIDRGYLKSAAERAYYLKDYHKALKVLDQADSWDLKPKERSELEEIRSACLQKINSQT